MDYYYWLPITSPQIFHLRVFARPKTNCKIAYNRRRVSLEFEADESMDAVGDVTSDWNLSNWLGLQDYLLS